MWVIESADEFFRLRRSTDPGEYGRAALDEASIETWQEVIRRFPEMRQWVAHNKTVPIEVLAVLAADVDSRVRSAVADKRKLTLDLFRLLAADPDDGVRMRVAYNRKVPDEVLRGLVSDPAALVREAAQGSLARRQPDS